MELLGAKLFQRVPVESPVSRLVGRFRKEAEDQSQQALNIQFELDQVIITA